MKTLEVLFSPAEFEALARRDLTRTAAVVFDVLRATSTIITALASGAEAVIPVATIEEALAQKKAHPAALLAGERDGFRITSQLTGSIDFDLGNSPRELLPACVAGKTIIMTTTNGTRALKSCTHAENVLIGSFLNLPSLAAWIQKAHPGNLLLICSGTHEEASFEDTLGAGSLCQEIWPLFQDGHLADSAQIARLISLHAADDSLVAMQHARNGRRLLQIPELHDDVAFCLQRGTVDLLARMDSAGVVRRWDGA